MPGHRDYRGFNHLDYFQAALRGLEVSVLVKSHSNSDLGCLPCISTERRVLDRWESRRRIKVSESDQLVRNIVEND